MNPIRRISYTVLNCGGVWVTTKLLGYDPWPATTFGLALCLVLATLDRIDMAIGDD